VCVRACVRACVCTRARIQSLKFFFQSKSEKKSEKPLLGCERESVNDPFAGSPTKTLLRLLLPLNGKVQSTSPQDTRPFLQGRMRPHNPVARIA
jgi:hypothetical protein